MQTRSHKNANPASPPKHLDQENNSETETDDVMTDDEDQPDKQSFNSRTVENHFKTETTNSSNQFLRSDGNSTFYLILSAIVVVILATVCFTFKDYMNFTNLSVQQNYTCGDAQFVLEHISAIKDKFSSQSEDTWYTFASGINQLFTSNPTGPAAFLLFHKADDETVNCLVKEISDLAARCFNGKASVFSITGEMLNNETYLKDSGELMVRFKDEITDKKVMIVYGLNDVPTVVAKEFHYFCDIHQPFVKNAVYFFTLRQEVADNPKNNKIIMAINNELRDLWRTLTYDKLDALITRMTSNVVQVNSEMNVKC